MSTIEVDDLVKEFGTFTAVRGVSFRVEAGEIFGYLGANGAGKSTTIRMLSGLLAPTRGSARVAGHDVATEARKVRLSVGYMSQRFSLYPDLSAIENLDFFGGAYELPRAKRLSRGRELLREVDVDPDDPTLAGAMPGGIRQRLALAAALLHEPRVVFLDEPTAGVDPVARRSFWRLIRRVAGSGVTIFVTTHSMDEAESCGRVGLMVDGVLAALDTPASLKATFVPGVIFDVRGDHVPREALERLSGVTHVEPFGASLHVSGASDLRADDLKAALASAGAVATVEPIAPTLEDVFLAVVLSKTNARSL